MIMDINEIKARYAKARKNVKEIAIPIIEDEISKKITGAAEIGFSATTIRRDELYRLIPMPNLSILEKESIVKQVISNFSQAGYKVSLNGTEVIVYSVTIRWA